MTKLPTELKKSIENKSVKLEGNVSAHTISPKQMREAQLRQKMLIDKSCPFEEHGL